MTRLLMQKPTKDDYDINMDIINIITLFHFLDVTL